MLHSKFATFYPPFFCRFLSTQIKKIIKTNLWIPQISHLFTKLSKIVTKLVAIISASFLIIPYKQIVFKGFYNEKLFTEVRNNQQIAQFLRLDLNDPQQKQELAELLQRVPEEFAGLTWALSSES